MFKGTRSSIEMLKGYTYGESLGTPALDHKTKTMYLILNQMYLIKICFLNLTLWQPAYNIFVQ